MLYLISYDIENNKKRQKIAELLKGYGERVQYSVFECHLTKNELEKIKSYILKEVQLEKKDSVRIYLICDACSKKVISIGKPREAKRSYFVI